MRLAKLSPFFFGAALLVNGVITGSAATTDPVGAVSKNLVAGTQILSVPFINEPSYQGTVDSVTGAVVDLTGLPTLPEPAFLLVIDGTAAGKISTIASSTASSVTLDSAISGLSSSDTIAIHAHTTLADISSYVSVAVGDIITLFNPDGSQLVSQYFDGYGWYAESIDANVDNYAVYPGEAFVLTTSTPREITFYGAVSSKQIVLPIGGGNVVNLVGTLDPVNGETVANTFPNAVNGNIFSAYTTSGGTITNQYNAQFFEGFGWYNEVSDSYVDDDLIETSTGAVISVSTASEAVMPPAYTP